MDAIEFERIMKSHLSEAYDRRMRDAIARIPREIAGKLIEVLENMPIPSVEEIRQAQRSTEDAFQRCGPMPVACSGCIDRLPVTGCSECIAIQVAWWRDSLGRTGD